MLPPATATVVVACRHCRYHRHQSIANFGLPPSARCLQSTLCWELTECIPHVHPRLFFSMAKLCRFKTTYSQLPPFATVAADYFFFTAYSEALMRLAPLWNLR
ncbi:hypothetical protein PIB30_030329 [Stylosanthes scabra]|uniref:Secreted protein n=1 Tax=Stylosanthes scabra TaxID=79078 RepID=A0ABU6TCM6_9FABA|nr:hypothetical protein [Stylosanthes scabra]